MHSILCITSLIANYTSPLYNRTWTSFQYGAPLTVSYLNESKSTHLHFWNQFGTHQYNINGKAVTTSDQHKDLGIFISSNLNFSLHRETGGPLIHGTDRTKWTLFITRSRLLFYFLFRIRSIYFRNIYSLQMALGV